MNLKLSRAEKVQETTRLYLMLPKRHVNYSGTVPFEEGMRVSGLYVKFQGSKGKKSADYDPVKLLMV